MFPMLPNFSSREHAGTSQYPNLRGAISSIIGNYRGQSSTPKPLGRGRGVLSPLAHLTLTSYMERNLDVMLCCWMLLRKSRSEIQVSNSCPPAPSAYIVPAAPAQDTSCPSLYIPASSRTSTLV
ncbi:hypothetical protein SODALDRAFT_363301 [Sodiomyces alkalinus F11]|uniref:Uncharacterized protein n=1 Tax=Sodiomyces alkalinus (strain CBS 110278 / VKM F-3762 / F11) TaxID=1314773 RepID=A0A3N2PLS7_SODAK|nr:hypothetical protein SODALDRAFT_363301 [Sodiomyces alkalinus F11]ROT35472.1 hypothetical protein SODALDRAFT_363301 [Sodiomyces alkalinus F11]